MTEAEVQTAIIEYLVSLDFLVLRINSGAKGHVSFVTWQTLGVFKQTTGVSDLLAISPNGHLYAIECKAPGKQAKNCQSAFLLAAARHGVTPVVADCLEDVIKSI